MTKRTVLTDGNDSDLIQVAGLGVYVPLERLRTAEAERDAVMIDGKIITKQQVAELMAQAEMHRNAEIMWKKTMMQAVGEDGPNDVIKAIDKIKAERDALVAMLVVIRDAYEVFKETGLADVVDDAYSEPTLARCHRELRAQAIEGAADHFVESGEASVTELMEYADQIRREVRYEQPSKTHG